MAETPQQYKDRIAKLFPELQEENGITIPEQILDDIYLSLLDAYERLDNGKANIKRSLNYLEGEHGYKPPKGYTTQDNDHMQMGGVIKNGEPYSDKIRVLFEPGQLFIPKGAAAKIGYDVSMFDGDDDAIICITDRRGI